MSAKERAKELFIKYIEFTKEWDELDGYVDDEYRAKECALIAINEMLDFRNQLYINEGSLAHEYLMDIKNEIEKL
jgi:hypothetical protein